MPPSPPRKNSHLLTPFTRNPGSPPKSSSTLELASSTARNPFVQESQRIVACLRSLIAQELPRYFPELSGRVKVTDQVSMTTLLETAEMAWNSCFPSKYAGEVQVKGELQVKDSKHADLVVVSTWAMTYHDLIGNSISSWLPFSSLQWTFDREKSRKCFEAAMRLDQLQRWFEERFCTGSMTSSAPTQSKLVWEAIQGVKFAKGTVEEWNKVKQWCEKNGRSIATGRFVEQKIHYGTE